MENEIKTISINDVEYKIVDEGARDLVTQLIERINVLEDKINQVS